MNGSKRELEERLAAQEKLLREMERSLEGTQKMIDETGRLLGAAKAADETPEGNSGPG